METHEQETVVRADERTRRIALAVLVVSTALGAAAIFALQSYFAGLQTLAESDPDLAIAKGRALLTVTSIATGAALVAFGGYLFFLSRRISASGRFPPPGMRVIRDTAVSSGLAARRRATATLAMAVVLVAGGVLLPVATFQLLEAFGRPESGQRR